VLHLTWSKQITTSMCYKYRKKSEITLSKQPRNSIIPNESKEDIENLKDEMNNLNIQSTLLKVSNLNINESKNDEKSNLNNNNIEEKQTNQELSTKSLPKEKNMTIKLIYDIFYLKSNIIFETNLKYLLLIFFLIYFLFNIFICTFYFKIDLPLIKLIPEESYLKRHMENHIKYFNIGPVLILNFIKPAYYTNNQTYSDIRSLLDDIKGLNGISNFEINWFDETIQKSKVNAQFYPECQENFLKADCFHLSLKEVISEPQNWNDVNILIENITNHSIDILIESHRIYLQIENFSGTLQDLELMNSLKYLADKKYNLKKEDLVVFSVVFKYLEEMNELFPEFVSCFLLTLECLFFMGLFLFFDLNSIFILMLIYVSTIVSIFSVVFLFDISLNVVTLFQFIIIPSLVFEFFFYTPYIYLFRSVEDYKKNKLNHVTFKSENLLTSSNADSSNSLNLISKEKIRIKYISFVYNAFLKNSCYYLFYNLFLSFIFMGFCSTYNFHSFFVILLSTIFNIFIHLAIFYPLLLMFFGTFWKSSNKLNM
jgi:hypothetical protein